MNQHGIAGIEFSSIPPTPFEAQGKGRSRRVATLDIGGLGSIDTSHQSLSEEPKDWEEEEVKRDKR